VSGTYSSNLKAKGCDMHIHVNTIEEGVNREADRETLLPERVVCITIYEHEQARWSFTLTIYASRTEDCDSSGS